MARSNKASKQKGRRQALPLVGAAGVSLALAGGASAAARQSMHQRRTHRVPSLRSARRKSPTSTWGRSMSSTRKTSSSANPCNLLAEAVAAAAAGAAQCALEAAAAAAAAEAAEAARCDPLAVVAAAVEAAAAAAGC